MSRRTFDISEQIICTARNITDIIIIFTLYTMTSIFRLIKKVYYTHKEPNLT